MIPKAVIKQSIIAFKDLVARNNPLALFSNDIA